MCELADELVTLGGVPLTGIQREGSWKRLGEIEGWWDTPQPKRSRIERDNADGEFSTPIFYEPRLITYNGRVSSLNHGYLHEAQQQIASLAFRGGAQFMVSGHGPAQWASVDPRGPISCTLETDTYLRFQIPLEAVDPFKYGATEPFTVSSGGASYVHHMGTVEAWPVVTVTGSMSDGYTLSYRSQTVSVPMGIPSGVTHLIDFKNRRLYVNGEVFFGAFGSSGFRPVPPGPRTAFGLSCPSGSGTAVVSVTDTYI